MGSKLVKFSVQTFPKSRVIDKSLITHLARLQAQV
jgi:hypothetical protein